jgi:hypothetical protein
VIHQLELSGLRRDWIEAAVEDWPIIVRSLPPLWTTDDLHQHLGDAEEPNWYGVLCASLKAKGLIARVGYRPSQRPEANGRVVAVWRGTR